MKVGLNVALLAAVLVGLLFLRSGGHALGVIGAVLIGVAIVAAFVHGVLVFRQAQRMRKRSR